ncbi:MAG: hypothetical protein AAGA66_13265 [Bacteroidota bacterium]
MRLFKNVLLALTLAGTVLFSTSCEEEPIAADDEIAETSEEQASSDTNSDDEEDTSDGAGTDGDTGKNENSDNDGNSDNNHGNDGEEDTDTDGNTDEEEDDGSDDNADNGGGTEEEGNGGGTTTVDCGKFKGVEHVVSLSRHFAYVSTVGLDMDESTIVWSVNGTQVTPRRPKFIVLGDHVSQSGAVEVCYKGVSKYCGLLEGCATINFER